MVMPIVLFPSAIISSFSGLLVPELTECKVQKNDAQISYIVCRVFQLSLLFSIGTAGLLICFSGELGLVIYNSTEAGRYIRSIAPLVPVMYMDTSTDAILKGLGEQVYYMNVNIIDSALGVLLSVTLLPQFGINGYITMIFICETVNAALSISRLLTVANFKPNIFRMVLGPLLCIGGACSAIKLMSLLFRFSHPSNAVGLSFRIVLTSAIYFVFARLTGCFSHDDVKWLLKIFKK